MGKWSETSENITREVLCDWPVVSFMRDNKCILKNMDGSFGAISLNDAMEYRYIIHYLLKREGETITYDSIDDLIEAGWVVD